MQVREGQVPSTNEKHERIANAHVVQRSLPKMLIGRVDLKKRVDSFEYSAFQIKRIHGGDL